MGKTLVKHFDPLWLSIAITNENCKSVFQAKAFQACTGQGLALL